MACRVTIANSHFTGQLVIGMNDPAARLRCRAEGNNTDPNVGIRTAADALSG